MNIRYADMSDLAAVTGVEAACFPPAEAATQQDFAQRLRYYSGHFWNEFVKMIFVSFLNSNIYLLKKRLTSRVGIFLETPYSKASSHFPIASH